MNISSHAKIRSQQRGIPENLISLILQFGTASQKPGNAWELRIGKKGKNQAIMHLKYLIQCMDKITNKAVIVNEEMDQIVTVYNKYDK
jgi:hypothetical protein